MLANGARIKYLLRKKGSKMMPLNLADIGEENTIKKIGGNPEIKTHLENLGFQVGGTVSIVNMVNGNIIVKVKESRIAIGEDMARKIMI